MGGRARAHQRHQPAGCFYRQRASGSKSNPNAYANGQSNANSNVPRLDELSTVWIGGSLRQVVRARHTHRGWLVQLDAVATRNEAEALRGQVIEVDRVALALGDDDVLLDDLVGCRVQRVDGTPWGTIAAVEGDLQDRLVIHDGEIERQLPHNFTVSLGTYAVRILHVIRARDINAPLPGTIGTGPGQAPIRR